MHNTLTSKDMLPVFGTKVELDPVAVGVVSRGMSGSKTTSCNAPIEVERYRVGADVFLIDLFEFVEIDRPAAVSVFNGGLARPKVMSKTEPPSKPPRTSLLARPRP